LVPSTGSAGLSEYSSGDSYSSPGNIITYISSAALAEGCCGAKEWSYQRKSDWLARFIMIERFDELTHPNHVGQQQVFIPLRACFRGHSFHEGPGKL